MTETVDNRMNEWAQSFRAMAAKRRIPISAALELTQRCNLRCRHCYLGNQSEQHRKYALERGTEEVKKSLSEWAEAGCLYLLITGGDPMIRPDFEEIYRHAKELGMLVTVFCDGILVTDRIVQLFRELPPRMVEVSIYGATAETYEAVTRVPGSWEKAWQGIRRLLDNQVRLSLKTILMTLNQHEFEAMEKQAEEMGLRFRYDGALFPCLPDNNPEPLDLRVDPEVMIAKDMATEERRTQWARSVDRAASSPDNDTLYPCGAGLTGFYADPFGRLSPCLMTTHHLYEQGDRPFIDLWNNELAELRKKKKTRADNAMSGAMRGVCTHCPAFNYIETGDEETPSDYMAQTAKLRYQAVMEWKKQQAEADPAHPSGTSIHSG